MCENSWAKKFTGVLAAAGVGAAVSSWYTGDDHSTGNVTSFADRLGDNLSSTISSAATPAGIERRRQQFGQRRRIVRRRLVRRRGWRRRRLRLVRHFQTRVK